LILGRKFKKKGNKMIELLKQMELSDIALTGAGIALLINFILAKLKLTEKINGLAKKISEKLAKFKEPIKKIGYNVGVITTSKAKKIPVIGIIYENGIEPLLLLVVHLLTNILVMFAGLGTLFLEGCSEGLQSDNLAKNKKDT